MGNVYRLIDIRPIHLEDLSSGGLVPSTYKTFLLRNWYQLPRRPFF